MNAKLTVYVLMQNAWDNGNQSGNCITTIAFDAKVQSQRLVIKMKMECGASTLWMDRTFVLQSVQQSDEELQKVVLEDKAKQIYDLEQLTAQLTTEVSTLKTALQEETDKPWWQKSREWARGGIRQVIDVGCEVYTVTADWLQGEWERASRATVQGSENVWNWACPGIEQLQSFGIQVCTMVGNLLIFAGHTVTIPMATSFMMLPVALYATSMMPTWLTQPSTLANLCSVQRSTGGQQTGVKHF